MWVNPLYEISSRESALSLARENSLATVIVGDPLRAAHLPVLVEEDADGSLSLVSHIPLVDPVARALSAGERALVIFNGARSYVSPAWYTEPGLPTYNFVTLHAQGAAEPMRDEQELRAHLLDLIEVSETGRNIPGAKWQPDAVAEARMNVLLPRIMGFRVRVDDMQAKAKLGQNRSAEDQVAVAEALAESPVEDDRTMADMMAKNVAERLSS